MTFESGAMGQWTSFNAAHGRRFGYSGIYGRLGSLHSPGARNGRPVTVHLDDGGELSGDAVLELVPDFSLDPETTVTLVYGEWAGGDEGMRALIDYGSNGEIDKQIELPNEQIEFDFYTPTWDSSGED